MGRGPRNGLEPPRADPADTCFDFGEYVTSAATARDCPRDRRAEVALIGRSNVGKSSLMTALDGDVAGTNAAPGTTRLA
jgi:GTP-binding protein EngB required for normal cell division